MPNTNASNQMALVSFLLSLVFPVVMLCNLSLNGYYTQPNGQPPMGELGTLVGAANTLAFGAMMAALLTGHAALRRAKWFLPPQALRGYAIIGLVIGYLSLAAVVGVLVLALVWGVVLFFQAGGLPNG